MVFDCYCFPDFKYVILSKESNEFGHQFFDAECFYTSGYIYTCLCIYV